MNKFTEKEKYRVLARAAKTKLDFKEISLVISEKISRLEEFKSAKTVMSYLAKDSEVSLNSLFNDKTKHWFVPLVKDSSLVLTSYEDGKTMLSKGAFGIMEPVAEMSECFDQIQRKIPIDLILVPGLYFDKKGARIGYGGGYYDKFLKLNPDSKKIGCCSRESLYDELPQDEWDVKVDLVVIS